MAIWVYNRPPEYCAESELKLAQRLNRLPDSWTVCWGYYYNGDHEGDFLVLGPNGLLVLEVKGGNVRQFSGTGRWEDGDTDNPLNQLFAEWKAVMQELGSHSNGGDMPFVGKALALPDVVIGDGTESHHGIPREMIIDARDLDDFEHVWMSRLFKGRAAASNSQREGFQGTYGLRAEPHVMRRFIDETDRLLLRQAKEEYEVLEMMAGNRQLLVEGGAGSGKTWLALQQAFRFAEHGEGQSVLLLCYNLALGRTLRALVGKKVLARGRVDVRCWEELAREILDDADMEWAPPVEQAQKQAYYDVEVPWLLSETTLDADFEPRYDALVVDEAQDHDTAFQHAEAPEDSLGWWDAYERLLRQGSEASIMAVYDVAQRPHFRITGAFDPGKLLSGFSQAAHVRLPTALRYSGPVFRYLKSLESSGTAALLKNFVHKGALLEGPDVELHSSGDDDMRKVVNEIVMRWVEQGLCRTDEILIVSPRSLLEKTSLAGVKKIGAWPLVEHEEWKPGTIPYISINKAKGLDSLAVIMIDVKSFESIEEEQAQIDYFMGASRARQLLAIVT